MLLLQVVGWPSYPLATIERTPLGDRPRRLLAVCRMGQRPPFDLHKASPPHPVWFIDGGVVCAIRLYMNQEL